MRRLRSAAVLFLFAATVHGQQLGPVDWIFLVDTSQSMRGVGKGNKDVFGDVKASINSFVREANDGDTVTIFTFDRDVSPRSEVSINATARADLEGIVHSLEADGNRTHLGAAIATGLQRAATLRATGGPGRSQAVVLFTDGKEDVRDIENPTAIDATIRAVGESFVFFVSMGEHETGLDAFQAQTPRTTVLKAPTAEEIRNVARTIRAKIPPPPPPPVPVVKTQPRPKPEPPPPPPPSPVARALQILAALAVIALVAWFLFRQQRAKNRLEGELEILRPRTPPDAAFVGLPKLQSSEVALSAILPLDALAGNDARLFVRRKAGRKKVWIAAQGGTLRVNDVETPVSELYDADTIEIGDARLRFNRVGDERPLESHQEGDL